MVCGMETIRFVFYCINDNTMDLVCVKRKNTIYYVMNNKGKLHKDWYVMKGYFHTKK